MNAQDKERERFETWRETAAWYVVAKPDPDEDRHSDYATTFRLMNIAASDAWTAAAQGRAELLEALEDARATFAMLTDLSGIKQSSVQQAWAAAVASEAKARAAIAKATGEAA